MPDPRIVRAATEIPQQGEERIRLQRNANQLAEEALDIQRKQLFEAQTANLISFFEALSGDEMESTNYTESLKQEIKSRLIFRDR